MNARHRISLALVAALLLGAVPSTRGLQRYEHGAAQGALSQLRMLAQRLSKQNLLYQMHMADQRKRDLLATAAEIDAALEALLEGDATLGVPKPPTPAIREQIEALDAAWGRLRPVAMSSPYDNLRRAFDSGGGDPLNIRYFDDLAMDVDRQAIKASELYITMCAQVDLSDCAGIAQATTSGMLTERMMKEAVLVIADMDARANMERLKRSRDAMNRVLVVAAEQEAVQSSMSPKRGTSGVLVAGIWRDVEVYWEKLRGDVDLVIDGRSSEVDIGATLEAQELLLSDLQRLSLAVRRFARARLASGWTPPK